MSTYLTTEAALLTLVRAYNSGATFTASNSAIDDWSVLDAQGATSCAVIGMGGDSTEGDNLDEHGSEGYYQEIHQPAVWVAVKRGQGQGGDDTAIQACKTLIEALKDYLRQYEKLNGTAGVSHARISRTTPPAYLPQGLDASTATHVGQRIFLVVQCESAVTWSETGW